MSIAPATTTVQCGKIDINVPKDEDEHFYQIFLSKVAYRHAFQTTYTDTNGKQKTTSAILDLNVDELEYSTLDMDELKNNNEKIDKIKEYLQNNYDTTFDNAGFRPIDFAYYKRQIIDCTQYSLKYYDLLCKLLTILKYPSEDIDTISFIHGKLKDLTDKLQNRQPKDLLKEIVVSTGEFGSLAILVRAHKKRDIFNNEIKPYINKLVSTLEKELNDLPSDEKGVKHAKSQLKLFRDTINNIDSKSPIEHKLNTYIQAVKKLDLDNTRNMIETTQDKLRYIDKISQIQKRNGEIINNDKFKNPTTKQLKTLKELEKIYTDKQQEYTEKKHQEQEQKTLEQLRENKFEKQVDEFMSTIRTKHENQQAKKTTKASRSNKPHQKKAKQSPQQYLSIVPMEKKAQHNYLSYLLVTLLGGVLLGGIIALLMYNDKQKKIQNQQARLQLKSAQDRQPNI